MLTKEEVQFLKAFITKKDVVFLDFKDEVLDHMSCEIEWLMQERDMSFSAAFTIVKNKWELALKPTFSMWYAAMAAPKLLLKKSERVMHLAMRHVLIVTLVLSSILYGVRVFFGYSVNVFNSNYIYILLLVIITIHSAYHLRQIASWKAVTTYSYCYKHLFYLAPICLLLILINEVTNTNSIPSSLLDQWIPIFGLLFCISIHVTSVTLFLKHKSYLKQQSV